jgi:hypothetical protein
VPIVRVFPEGTSGGYASEPPTADRGEIKGWTSGAARRMIRWLWSVETMALPSHGFAATLTTGGRPDTAAEWAEARHAFIKRARRLGLLSGHWVTEWTAAGRPHMHMALWMPHSTGMLLRRVRGELVLDWQETCDRYGWPSDNSAQVVKPITSGIGWSKYVSKHASRGVAHYQRQGIPPGWEKTGRLWGHWGEWPTRPPLEAELSDVEFARYKSLVSEHVDRERRLRDADTPRYVPPVGGVGEWVPHALAFGYLLRATEGRWQLQSELGKGSGNESRGFGVGFHQASDDTVGQER